jgi:hypothetical protein
MSDYDDGYRNGSNEAVAELKGTVSEILQLRIDELRIQKREIESTIGNLVNMQNTIRSRLETS